jgi:integrase
MTAALAAVIPLRPASARTDRYDEQATGSANTRRAYACQWQAWERWARERGVPALPATPSDVAEFAADLADEGRPVSSILLALAAIRDRHLLNDMPTPTDAPEVKQRVKGIRRALGVAPKTQAAPALVDSLKAMLAQVDLATPGGLRDRALLLVGMAGAFRRAELVALDVADLAPTPDGGLVVTVRRSKTDQDGRGSTKSLARTGTPTCPVAALEKWLEAAGMAEVSRDSFQILKPGMAAAATLAEGPIFRRLFRSGKSSKKLILGGRLTAAHVDAVVVRYATAAGLEAGAGLRWGGHSLRSGFVTQGYLNDIPEWKIAEQTGHASVKVMRGYMRRAVKPSESAAARLGL